MQSMEIDGLKEIIQTLETTPEVIRQARAEFFDEAGEVLLEAVQRHIGGSGRVAGVQESYVGSGKGYVAVRPMAKTNLDGYAAGYITNALENGHAVRPASGKAKKKRRSRAKANRVQGKYMYRNTGQQEAERAAEEGARYHRGQDTCPHGGKKRMTKTEILDAINLLLVSKWPDRTVYVDVCPVDFNRPSFWLTVEKYDLTDGNRFLIRHDLQIRLTLYDELDEHYDASWYRLSQETDAVTELLIRGWMVGRRHLKPLLKVLPRDPDRAYVQINLSWMDNRPGLDTGASTPAADAYSVTVRGDIN